MRLEQLRIIQLPGIDKSFTLEGLHSGINLITGPNASGKSSLVRALRYLIEEDSECPEGALSLEADFRSEDSLWQVSRSGRQIVWRQDGREAEKPSFPSGSFLYCYWLSMHDLLEEGATDREILRNLRRALAGGYDVQALRRTSVFNSGERFGRKQMEVYEEQERKLREILNNYAALDRERGRVSELELEIEEARRAGARANQVQLALDLLQDRDRRREAENDLSMFPAGIELLRGGELDSLTKLEEKYEKLSQTHKMTRYSLEQARIKQRETGLADQPPLGSELAAGRRDLEEVKRFQERLNDNRKRLQAARENEREIAVRLGAPSGKIPSVTPDKAQRAITLAEEWWECREKLSSLRNFTDIQESPGEQLGEMEEMIKELRRWLRQIPPSAIRNLFISGGAGAALMAAALLSALIGGAWASFAFSFLALLPAVWILWNLNLMRFRRLESEQRMMKLNIPPPENWHLDEVEQRLNTLEKKAADLREQWKKAESAERFRRESESVEKELRDKEAEKDKLAMEIGLAPGSGFETVAQFHHLVREFNQARENRISLETSVKEVEEKVSERMDSLVALLRRHHLCPQAAERSINSAEAGFQRLCELTEKLQAANRDCSEAERELSRLTEEMKEIEGSKVELYHKVGLERGERENLVVLCEKFPEYNKARRKKENAENLEKDKQRRLGQEDPELSQLVESDDEAGLSHLWQKLKEKSSLLPALYQEEAGILERLKQAGQDRQLEKRRMERDKAYTCLYDAYEKTMFVEAGLFLLDEIEEEHRNNQEPAVVAAARDRFERYTDNRYSLELDSRGNLLVIDTRRQLRQGAETLSSGTRMQLFMALRLGWTGMLEKNGESLPVFLDEALTTADPERFDNIARNLRDTADTEGRQMFYLTAQPSDLHRWKRAVGEQPNHIHLPWLRFKEEGGEPEDYLVGSLEKVPPPGDMDATEYAARLGVEAPDPVASIGSLHIFHLLRDDLPLLHKLMNDWRIIHLGPLERLLNSDVAVHAVDDGEKRQRLLARCRIAGLWADSRRLGRGRPVDRNVLEKSEVISGNFLTCVTDLARQLNGDAEKLLARLAEGAVPRFRRRKVEELRQWLEANGYIDDREILSAEQRRERIMMQAAGFAPAKEIQRVILHLERAEKK